MTNIPMATGDNDDRLDQVEPERQPPAASDASRQPITALAAEMAEKAQRALQRVKRHWDDWAEIGRGVFALREEAMRISGANTINSGVYARTFSRLLDQHGLGDRQLGKDIRAALLRCMENLDRVEAWRAALTDHEQLRWNSPLTVWKNFEKAHVVPAPTDAPSGAITAGDAAEQDDAGDDEAADVGDDNENRQVGRLKKEACKLNEELARLSERLHGVAELNGTLVKENQQLRRSHAVWSAEMDETEIADAIGFDLSENLAPEKAAAVIAELMKRMQPRAERTAQPPPLLLEYHRVVPSTPPSLEERRAPTSSPKRGRPRTGTLKIVASIDGWAVMKYARPENGGKLEWLVVEQCATREKAEEVIADRQFVLGAASATIAPGDVEGAS